MFPGARTVYVTARCLLVPDVKQDISYEPPRFVNLKVVFYKKKKRAFTFIPPPPPFAVPHNVQNSKALRIRKKKTRRVDVIRISGQVDTEETRGRKRKKGSEK
jgi:hypothetical protein